MFEYFDTTTIFLTLMFILHSFLTFLKIIILENWNYIISFSQIQTKYFITFSVTDHTFPSQVGNQ